LPPTIDILSASPWQMTYGERSALEGLLSELQPAISIEIGTAEGGSLRRVAHHSGHVHSFDLVTPDPAVQELENVTFHTGDSHKLVPELLAKLAEEGVNVDFALVDGDHTADGVEQDMRDLIASDAIKRTIVIAHDTLNDEVREGLARVDYAAEPKIVHADLDFIGGHLSTSGDFANQLWGGIGLFVFDADGELELDSVGGSTFHDLFDLVAPIRDRLVSGGSPATADASELEAARADAAQAREDLAAVVRSPSWRLTAPLRVAKRAVNERRAGR
jgi:hypothetical protein